MPYFLQNSGFGGEKKDTLYPLTPIPFEEPWTREENSYCTHPVEKREASVFVGSIYSMK